MTLVLLKNPGNQTRKLWAESPHRVTRMPRSAGFGLVSKEDPQIWCRNLILVIYKKFPDGGGNSPQFPWLCEVVVIF